VSRAIDDAVWALRQHVARRQVVEEEYRTAATRIAVAVPGSVVDALESMREATEPARGNNPETLRRGVMHHASKLTDATVREARALAATGDAARALARRFGVSQKTMRNALDGRTWKHV
jgi:hypothetical protein